MVTSYPVEFDVAYPARPLDRLTTAFRIFVVIPIAIVFSTLSGETYNATNHSMTYVVAGAGGPPQLRVSGCSADEPVAATDQVAPCNPALRRSLLSFHRGPGSGHRGLVRHPVYRHVST